MITTADPRLIQVSVPSQTSQVKSEFPDTIDELMGEPEIQAVHSPNDSSAEALAMIAQDIYASLRERYIQSLQAQIERRIPEPRTEGFLLFLGDGLDTSLQSDPTGKIIKLDPDSGRKLVSRRSLATLTTHQELVDYIIREYAHQNIPESGDKTFKALQYDPFTKEVSEIEFTPAFGYTFSTLNHNEDRRRFHATLALALSQSGSVYSISVKTPDTTHSISSRPCIQEFADLSLITQGSPAQLTELRVRTTFHSQYSRLRGGSTSTSEMIVRDIPPWNPLHKDYAPDKTVACDLKYPA